MSGSDSALGRTAPLGVLVVGAGFAAESHLAALDGAPAARLAGVVDVDSARAAAAARAHGGVPVATDLATALRWPGVDACIVCTPNDTHAEVAAEVAAAGKHLLVEKPLAVSVEAAGRIVDDFAAKGLTVMAAHTHRFYDYAQAVKAELDSGAVGRVLLVRLALLGGWIWPDWRAWMVDVRRSGGHALHNGVHLLDLVTWWVGDRPVSVYARGSRQTSPDLEIHDYLEMVVRYAGGATAICEMSRGHRPAGLAHRDVLVQGTVGTLSMPWDAEGGLLVDENGPTLLPPAGGDGFARQLGAWLATIRTGDPGPYAARPSDAVRAVALAVAAEHSIASGESVPVGDVFPELVR